MTPIESIYEIEEALSDLQKYLHSKDRIVSKKVQMKYKQLVDRFFKSMWSMKDDNKCPVN